MVGPWGTPALFRGIRPVGELKKTPLAPAFHNLADSLVVYPSTLTLVLGLNKIKFLEETSRRAMLEFSAPE